MQKPLEFTGQRFGWLTVKGKSPDRQNRNVYWVCECACGKITVASGSALKGNNKQSCGCKNAIRLIKLRRPNYSIAAFENIFNPEAEYD